MRQTLGASYTPGVITTALHERLAAAGARFAELDGFETALDFGDPGREAAAVRAAVGIADRGSRAFTLIAGPDAGRFLQGLVSNDVAAVAVGSATYALILTPKARVIADLRLTRVAEDAYLADSEASAAADLRTTLTRYRLAAKARIEPAEDRYGALAVAGPKAPALIAAAFGFAARRGAPEGEGHQVVEGLHAIVSVFCGAPAYELIGLRETLPAAWDALAAVLPAFEGRPFGATAAETLRIEAGVPRFGAELTGEVMPAEAGVVGRAVSFTKGCYIGQEPVARLHYRGHANRGLRTILVDGAPPEPGATVSHDGRDVGRVTSAAVSPALGRTVALAIVRREVEPGQRVSVGDAEGVLASAPAYPRA